MPRYNIRWQDTFIFEVDIEASSKEEARAIALDKFTTDKVTTDTGIDGFSTCDNFIFDEDIIDA